MTTGANQASQMSWPGHASDVHQVSSPQAEERSLAVTGLASIVAVELISAACDPVWLLFAA